MSDLDVFHDMCYDVMDAAVDAIIASSPLETDIACRIAMMQKGITDPTRPTPYEAGAIDTARVILLDHVTTFFGDDALSSEEYRAAGKTAEQFVVACERFVAAMWRKDGEPLRKKAYVATLYGKTFEYRDLPAFPDIAKHVSELFKAVGLGGCPAEDEDEDEEEEPAVINKGQDFNGFINTAELESCTADAVRREIGSRIYAAAYLRSIN